MEFPQRKFQQSAYPFQTFDHDKSLYVYECIRNRPRSIYQYSSMAPRLLGQTSIFGVVFFVFKSILGIERQKKLKKIYNFDPKASEPCQNIDISKVAYQEAVEDLNKKQGKPIAYVSCFPLHFFRALPLPACFTTEQSKVKVENSLFAKYRLIGRARNRYDYLKIWVLFLRYSLLKTEKKIHLYKVKQNSAYQKQGLLAGPQLHLLLRQIVHC